MIELSTDEQIAGTIAEVPEVQQVFMIREVLSLKIFMMISPDRKEIRAELFKREDMIMKLRDQILFEFTILVKDEDPLPELLQDVKPTFDRTQPEAAEQS